MDAVPETRRLEVLRSLHVLDTPSEPEFDAAVHLARRVFGVPMAAVTLIDDSRQWIKARDGLDVCETTRDDSICTWTIRGDDVLVVPDARADQRFASVPLVATEGGIRFYAGAPLVVDGARLGALCVMDTLPRTLSEGDRETLREMALLVSGQLRLRAAYRALKEQADAMTRIVGSAGEGIVVADAAGRFSVFNARAEEILGKGAQNVAPASWAASYGIFAPDAKTVFPPSDLPLARALRGEPSDHVPMIIRRADGDVKIEVSGRPLRGPEGEVRGGVVTFGLVDRFREDTERLVSEARTDALTGLPNRRALDELLARHLPEAALGRPVALVLADLDHFKSINDRFGHAEGDRVLAAAAEALRGALRATDFVARFGGEEFCVLLLDAAALKANEIAEKMRHAVKRAIPERPVTASFGVAEAQGMGIGSTEGLLKAADRALYCAKEGGRDRVIAASKDP